MLRIPHCLESRLTGGGKVVSLTLRPRSTPEKHFLLLISVRGSVNPRAIVRLEELGTLKKINSPHGNSNPLPSGLLHSASTNYATGCPRMMMMTIIIIIIIKEN
jgi:hypothetical protein